MLFLKHSGVAFLRFRLNTVALCLDSRQEDTQLDSPGSIISGSGLRMGVCPKLDQLEYCLGIF